MKQKTVVSSKMFKSLRRIFETVPLPHLPDPCFKTKTESTYTNRFEDIYRKFKSNVIDDKNTLNFTNIANYTHNKLLSLSRREFMVLQAKHSQVY
ncbi:hypothetical protein Avbf_07224 [Armadillidium vulgare]|nr:hypothetical protein Avbf_07224 [Armadillidium vulgare]